MSGVPDTLGRFIVLLLTPLYLLLLASLLHAVTHRDHLAMIIAVFSGAAGLVAIIAVLKGRVARSTDRESGLSIGTMMWLTVGFSIYMAYISQFMKDARTLEFSLYGVASFLFYCGFFIAVTTIVLIRFTDALLAVTAWALGFFRRSAEK